MEVIPVIDLMGGVVVHARAGERERYRPLRSRICKGSAPENVVRALLDLHPFERLYIADLDAIRQQGDHDAAIEALSKAFPQLSLWVDAGIAGLDASRRWLARGLGELVLGSESQTNPRVLEALREEAPERVVLSLDFRSERFLGPPALLELPATWPPRVIVMTLARVGSGQGPDMRRLRTLRRRAPAASLFAAGGVRGLEDLRRLGDIGASGALVASSLHDGRIGAAELAKLAGL